MTPTSKVDKVIKPKVSTYENPNFIGFRALLPSLKYNNNKESNEESVQDKSDNDFEPDIGKKTGKKAKTKRKVLKNAKNTKAKTSKSTKIAHLNKDMIPYLDIEEVS